MEAWKWISEDITLFHRLSPFWIQVFCFAGKRGLLTEELVMRMAYLSGYEKNFSGSLYQALVAGYEKFPSEDILEAVCKYVMKGNPRKPEYFRWFSLAVQQGLRLTRLYEYYVETMDISYQRELPKPLLMYLTTMTIPWRQPEGLVYASDESPAKRRSPRFMKATGILWEKFARAKIAEGHMDENYAGCLSGIFCWIHRPEKMAELAAGKLFTYRLYCDDKKNPQSDRLP